MNYDTFLITNSNKFPSVAIGGLHSQMQTAPEGAQIAVMTASYREPIVALLLSFFLGVFGFDRFYIGDVGLGVGKLAATFLTFGVAGFIWWFIDLFLIMGATRRKNYEEAMTILSYAGMQQGSTANYTDQGADNDTGDDSDFDDF